MECNYFRVLGGKPFQELQESGLIRTDPGLPVTLPQLPNYPMLSRIQDDEGAVFYPNEIGTLRQECLKARASSSAPEVSAQNLLQKERPSIMRNPWHR
jgi:hypothetical protein